MKQDGFTNVSFICIDSNKALIEQCKQTASNLNMTNMIFYNANIIESNFTHQPDIVYSLHACDSATDEMIYQGITQKAKYILSVSCCQHRMRNQMKNHPLALVTRHKPYKERLTDMIADSLRVLILEASGYKVTVYEFVAAAYTPKNVMLKCERMSQTNQKTELAMLEYEKLSKLFNMRPMLSHYLASNHDNEKENI